MSAVSKNVMPASMRGVNDARALGFVDAHAEVIAAEADERNLERFRYGAIVTNG